MTWAAILPWLALAGLGALHGINPGMGWLFAVALGLQERKGAAVWRALPPLALGHGLAIAVVVALAAVVGLVLPLAWLKWSVAGLLLAMGVYRMFRHGHPRYGGMQVGPLQLTIWSFLMASAHGAGLMVLPIVLGMRARTAEAAGAEPAGADHGHGGHGMGSGVEAGAMAGRDGMGSGMEAGVLASEGGGHAGHMDVLFSGMAPGQWEAVAVTLVHTLGYLLVTGVVAVIVYRKLGLRLLRSAWINLDLIWAGALILTALVTPFL
jgi:hypothetical protein